MSCTLLADLFAGDRLKEATKINLSLSALGNVISALVDGKSGVDLLMYLGCQQSGTISAAAEALATPMADPAEVCFAAALS